MNLVQDNIILKILFNLTLTTLRDVLLGVAKTIIPCFILLQTKV